MRNWMSATSEGSPLVPAIRAAMHFIARRYSGTGIVRLTYRRPSDDTLAVTLDKAGGKEEFRFRRAPAP